jgi:serpin B
MVKPGVLLAGRAALMNVTARTILVPILAAASVSGACGGGGDPAPVAVDQARSEKLRVNPTVPEADRNALAAGNVGFALALHRQVSAGKYENLVFSPASISTALAMTFAGARGETETQMATALKFTLPQAQLHPAMNELDQTLAARGQGTSGADGKPFRLRMVNSAWADKQFTMLPAYLDVLAESYGAGVNLLDFVGATESARQTINRWVEQQTEDRIKELLPMGALDQATVLVLTNAVYFNAAWKVPFPERTADGDFKRLDGSMVKVPMMRHEASFKAAQRTGYAAVALPYQDERLSMLIVVPDEGKLAEVEAGLTAAALTELAGSLTPQSVILAMPRFRFETPIDLKQALSDLGMPVAFTGGADFSGIDGSKSLFIQAVLHKAFIAVAEKGTEAAAATAVVVGRTSAPQGLNITANRPFLFFLRDEPTGAILFMGRVADPSR